MDEQFDHRFLLRKRKTRARRATERIERCTLESRFTYTLEDIYSRKGDVHRYELMETGRINRMKIIYNTLAPRHVDPVML